MLTPARAPSTRTPDDGPADRSLISADSPAPEATADGFLLQRIGVGDPTALALLLNQYWGPLVVYVGRTLDSRDQAEDVVQETFVRIWERREQWKPEGSLRALLYQIAHNLAADHRRRRAARERWLAQQQGQVTRGVVTPLERVEEHDLEIALARAVNGLPERRREVFLLVRQAGLSYQDVAQVLGLAPQTVANHLSLALAELRAALEGFLDSPEEP